MRNIKALALTVQKLLAKLNVQRGGQNDRQDKNNMPPDLQSRGHKNKITSPLKNHLLVLFKPLKYLAKHFLFNLAHIFFNIEVCVLVVLNN